MSTHQERLDRFDALYRLLGRLPELGAGTFECGDDDKIDLFFPVGDPDTEGTPAWREAQQAKAICQRCPVQGSCLQYALAEGEREGIWGGTTPGERRSLLLLRRRGDGTSGEGVAA